MGAPPSGHPRTLPRWVQACDPRLGSQGFRLLLASPCACYNLFREKQEEGFGGSVLFGGVNPDTLHANGKGSLREAEPAPGPDAWPQVDSLAGVRPPSGSAA